MMDSKLAHPHPPNFTLCLVCGLLLFGVFGVHRRIVAPTIISRRYREALSPCSLGCDQKGKNNHPSTSSQSNSIIIAPQNLFQFDFLLPFPRYLYMCKNGDIFFLVLISLHTPFLKSHLCPIEIHQP